MFSEKYNYKPQKEIQIEEISDTLRQRIWNLFYLYEIQAGGLGSQRLSQTLNGDPLLEDIIADQLGFSIRARNTQHLIEDYILQSSEWYEVYDFIEMHISF